MLAGKTTRYENTAEKPKKICREEESQDFVSRKPGFCVSGKIYQTRCRPEPYIGSHQAFNSLTTEVPVT